MSRILVTGATGFIGRALCRRLQERHEVLALVRPASAKAGMFEAEKGIRTVWGGLENCGPIFARPGRIDAVIHLGWGGMSKEAQTDAASQTQDFAQSMSLVSRAGVAGCRLFIGGGSQAEYGPVGTVITELSECRPTSEYGRAKLRFTIEGGRLCAQLGMKWRMPRIFSVYGPDDHPWTLLPALLLALSRREVMPLTDCRQLWNYLFVDDAARALEALLDPACEDGIYNIGSEFTAPLKDFVLQACALFPGSPLPRFAALPHGPDGPHSLQPAVKKLIDRTGWREMVGFADGLKQTWASLQNHRSRSQ